MSLLDDLGYRVDSPNPVQRGVQAVAASRGGAAILSRTLAPLDSATQRISGRRWSFSEVVGGLPMIDVMTTGRRSGQPRTTHLFGVPYHDVLAILGTNFGGARTPAWVLNLEANPAATVTYRDRTAAVTARLADAAEREDVFAVAQTYYDGYRLYPRRVTGRQIRVFVLEPAPAGTG